VISVKCFAVSMARLNPTSPVDNVTCDNRIVVPSTISSNDANRYDRELKSKLLMNDGLS
jgi:hypothetical protein